MKIHCREPKLAKKKTKYPPARSFGQPTHRVTRKSAIKHIADVVKAARR